MSRSVRIFGAALTMLGAALPALGANASTPRLLDLQSPSAMVVSGSTLWIAEQGASSLVQLNAGTGAYIATIGPKTLGVGRPDSMVVSATHLFVASTGGAVAELTTSAKHVRTIKTPNCALSNTTLATSSAGLIELCSNGTINLINLSTGKVTKSLKSSTTKLTDATSMLVVKSDLFVTNVASGTAPDEVVEFALGTFASLKSLTNLAQPSLALSSPMGIGFDGTDLWVTNSGNDTITEINRATLSFVSIINGSGTSYNLWMPQQVLTRTVAGVANVYVANVDGQYSSMVTRFTAPKETEQDFDWTMCNTNDHYQFWDPSAMVLTGNTLWVVSRTNGVLDQMDATSGALMQEIL
jgi:hypothetical protein